MPRSLEVFFLPQLAPPWAWAGAAVAVIDVLRASTVMVEALAQGAREVWPCLEVDQARQRAAQLASEPGASGAPLLGGERGGLPIEGFDLGNSPREYRRDRVGGRSVVFTTTNGTRALEAARAAEAVIVACPANASAAAEYLARYPRVVLLCAGTRGEVSREDVLGAGQLIELLVSKPGEDQASRDLNDQARLALAAWRDLVTRGRAAGEPMVRPHQPSIEWLAAELGATQGGRNLAQIGLAGDILDVARTDRWSLVPRWESTTGRMVPAPDSGSPAMSAEAALVIDGEVGRPARLDWAALRALPAAFQIDDVSQIDPRRRGGAVWLTGLLAQVEPRATATHLTLHATADDFHASVPLDSVRASGMLIYRLGEEPLPASQGGPLRFYIRDHASCHAAEVDECANVKFVDRIELTAGKGYDNRPQDEADHARLHGH